ncbi:SMP-30/gluconolactonase/LRE family protein [Paenibacillus wynnii]|uniref:SMP-30/gluconolactonase/LRE family protein n=1 Tax=Paenibacillus wynnii TaxID=268407 RepID=UPI002792F8C7|nr:SMP-30/gluconolactonase/LRE family protein [Paenibacillus wynnii]MDQ0194727.1 sugar lactone lactonase YvrE [Paenibacillus wynnii]
MLKKVGLSILVFCFVVIVVFLFIIPSPIDPTAWNPPKQRIEEGPLQPNSLLERTQILTHDLIQPEDLLFDEEGRLYTGTKDGMINRLILNNQEIESLEVIAETGGYPLGLQFDSDGHLIAAVKEVGLVSIDPNNNNEITVLTNSVENQPISYANELTILNEGIIYFTDSSTDYDAGWPYDLLEGKPHGRLLSYDPKTNETSIIIRKLHFANGVVLSPDEDYLLIAEMFRYRILRYWLKGPKAHTTEVFTENLPLMPDNISIDDEGDYWIAGNKRLPMIDGMQSKPFLKKQIAKLPHGLLMKIPTQKSNRYGIVLRIGSTGEIKSSYHDPSGRVFSISTALRKNDTIYLGTLMGDYIGRFDLGEESE